MKLKTLIGSILLIIFIAFSIKISIKHKLQPFKIDDYIYEQMTYLKDNNFLVILSKILSYTLSIYTIIPISIVLLIIDFKNNKYIIISLIFTLLLTFILKTTIQRERPPYLTRLEDISSKSFPSGHSLNAIVFYLQIAYMYKDKLYISIPLIILTPLIAISRLILNVHWFSDIIIGLTLGISINLLVISYLEKINKNKIILASNSPRRANLLNSKNIEYITIKPKINENIKEYKPIKYVQKVSFKKLQNIKKLNKESVIISADTIVTLNNKIYRKEESFFKALNNLLELNNKQHEVITSVWVYKNKKYKNITKISKVTFKNNSLKDILVYLNKNTYKDKAGSYAIQDEFNNLIEKYEGDYNNIVGLPIDDLVEVLNEEF